MTQTHAPSTASGVLNLRVGELVEVRGAAEILATLDERGELEDLPFTPEMYAFVGKRLRVAKVATKLCDPVNRGGLRRMTNSVHLTAARCDGSAHGGCQTACLLYFKEQWLRRVDGADGASEAAGADPTGGQDPAEGRALLPLLVANTNNEPAADGSPRYRCQATEIYRAAPTPLPMRNLGQYVQDVRVGNVSWWESLRAFLIALFNRLQDISGKRLPPRLRLRGGLPWRFLAGKATGGKTPSVVLGLRPGELVRVRSKDEIAATLNKDLLNRGMGFDTEMLRFCGRTARVQSIVTKCLDEGTGELLTMKTPCVILEDMACIGGYNQSCPRGYIPFWREIWLERVEDRG